MFDWFAAMRETLLSSWSVLGRRRRVLRGAIGHATEFSTWHSLARLQGLSEDEAVEVMVASVRCLATFRP